ncbi:LPXTG cell wall anchor domain-containing protein [Aquihabitans sp. G128]|uniref:LPXTG cell wall anchor domain-containing protein n=1 Tax=Aquihabitans sp. G128 TaxID=2849779 RepID=UPI001C22986E|nr:LPXTG cell wall anchor domain-containing protein [Aquihabitans sp. G128]QXC60750.1 LPXTG cell wall anchor domain-containing protein [Aquihabitans sp. G128]
MHTEPTPTPVRRRARRPLLGALVGLAAATAVLFAAAAPASATNEFPAKPTASATFSCDTGGPVVTLHLGNVGGLSSAHFDVDQTSKTTDHYDVAAGSSTLVLRFGAPEDADTVLSVTGTDGFAYTVTFEVDCFHTLATLVQTCDGDQPVITATVTQDGPAASFTAFYVNGTIVDSSTITDTGTYTAEVPDGEAFIASVFASADNAQIALLQGTPDCAPAPTTTTSTTTSTTIPPSSTTSTTTSTTVAPAAPAPTDPPQVVAQQVVRPAPVVTPTVLPRTGSSTLPLTLLGVTLVGLGAFARRFAKARQA